MTATERLDVESMRDQLRRSAIALRLIAEISSMIGQSAPLPTILTRIAAGAAELLGTPYSAILLLTLDARQLRIESAYGLAPAYIEAINRHGMGAGSDASLPSVEVCRRGEPIIWNNLAEDPSMSHLREAQQLQGVRAMIAVPLIGPDGVIGSLNCYHQQPHRFRLEDIEPLTTISYHAAVAIHNARLLEQLRASIRRLSEMNAVIQHQHETLARSEEIHRRLTTMVLEEHGLRAVLRTLASLLDCGVCLYDRRLSPLAEAGVERPGAAAAPRLTPALFKGGQLDSRPRAGALIQLEAGPGVAAPAVVCPLVARQQVLGYIATPDTPAVAGDLGRRAIEHAAIVCALELLKQQVVRETEWRQASGFLDDLLSGRLEGQSEILTRADLLGVDLSNGLRLMCVRPESGAPRLAGAELLQQLGALLQRLLAERSAASLIVPRGDRCLVVLPTGERDYTAAHAEALRVAIAEAAPGLAVAVALSAPAERAEDLLRAYHEVEETLAVLNHLGAASGLLCYEDVGVFGLILRGSTREELLRMARRRLGRLAAYGERRGVDLLGTLECYLEAGCSPQRAAERLFIHPNTVKHRLSLIGQLSGADLGDMRRLLELQLALLVRRLHPAGFLAES